MRKSNPLYKSHLISSDQFTKKSLELIFKESKKMKKIVDEGKQSAILRKYCIAELFYQPSTRTFASFLAAAERLGAMTIPIHGMDAYSSAVKGESLRDTIETICQTTAADAIILRHPDDDSSEIASQVSEVPIINAGSGKKEHPTQAILDLYTITNELGKTSNLKVAFLGDLKYGRTIKSLGHLLTLIDRQLKLFLISPKNLKMPPELVKKWERKGVKITETEKLADILPCLDVLYVTRVQKEWFKSEGEYQQVAKAYVVDKELMKKAKKRMIVMHPLPRVSEISTEVDCDPRAVYFKQMRYGLYTRMAILKLILCR